MTIQRLAFWGSDRGSCVVIRLVLLLSMLNEVTITRKVYPIPHTHTMVIQLTFPNSSPDGGLMSWDASRIFARALAVEFW